MKKRTLFLALTLMMTAMMTLFTVTETKAQGSLLLSGGIALSNDNLSENFEVGGDFGKNTLTLNVQTTDATAVSDRLWYGGVKYYRNVTVSPTLNAFGSASVLVGLRQTQDIVFSPGVGLNLKLARNLYWQGSISTPIAENSTLFRPTRLQAGTQLVLKFDN